MKQLALLQPHWLLTLRQPLIASPGHAPAEKHHYVNPTYKTNNTIEREKAKRDMSNNGQTVIGYIPGNSDQLKTNFLLSLQCLALK